jgi:hypothetical protein
MGEKWLEALGKKQFNKKNPPFISNKLEWIFLHC